MRDKVVLKRIAVREEVYDRLRKDKAHFQKVIGGGKWSFSDTLTEYFKIMKE